MEESIADIIRRVSGRRNDWSHWSMSSYTTVFQLVSATILPQMSLMLWKRFIICFIPACRARVQSGGCRGQSWQIWKWGKWRSTVQRRSPGLQLNCLNSEIQDTSSMLRSFVKIFISSRIGVWTFCELETYLQSQTFQGIKILKQRTSQDLHFVRETIRSQWLASHLTRMHYEIWCTWSILKDRLV